MVLGEVFFGFLKMCKNFVGLCFFCVLGSVRCFVFYKEKMVSFIVFRLFFFGIRIFLSFKYFLGK